MRFIKQHETVKQVFQVNVLAELQGQH